MSERPFRSIGQGIETSVFHRRRGSKDSAVVVKPYEELTNRRSDGFNAQLRDRLEKNVSALRRVYGALIPRQRFLRKESGRFYLVQEKLDLADPPSIFSYSADRLQPKIKVQLQTLIAQLKEQSRVYQEQPTDAVFLDFHNPRNLVVTTDDRLVYLDTGLMNRTDQYDDYAIETQQLVPLALLEHITGQAMVDVLHDDVYRLLDPYLDFSEENKALIEQIHDLVQGRFKVSAT